MSMVHSGQEAVLPTCALALVAALLAGCVVRTEQPAPGYEPPPSTAAASTSQLIYDGTDGEIRTICHNGRLLYVLNAYKGGGVAVVENADECRTTTANSVGMSEANAPTTPPVKTGEG